MRLFGGFMSLDTVGQRCVSEREPELGLGIVAEIDRARRTNGDEPIPVKWPALRQDRGRGSVRR